jgi:hypothetical protein
LQNEPNNGLTSECIIDFMSAELNSPDDDIAALRDLFATGNFGKAINEEVDQDSRKDVDSALSRGQSETARAYQKVERFLDKYGRDWS